MNTHLLVRPTNQQAVASSARCAEIYYDILRRINRTIPPLIDWRISQAPHLFANKCAQLLAALADATGEYERVDRAAELEVVRPHVVKHPIRKKVERKARIGVVASALRDGRKVRRACEGLPPCLRVEDVLRLRDVQVHGVGLVVRHATRLVGVVENERGVDGAGARRAGEAVERGEAHGGVEGLAVLDAAGGRTGSEVEHYEVEGGGRLRKR
jgi:hypothetical protein